MSAHNGAVDHGVLIVGIGGEMLEQPFPDTGAGPAGEAGVDLDRIAEPLKQVAPRNAGAITVEHGIDKQTVVASVCANMTFAAGQQILDAIPLVVAQGIAAHRSVSQ